MKALLTSLLLLTTFFVNGQERDEFLDQKGYYKQTRWTLRDTALVNDILDKAAQLAYAEALRSERLCRVALSISDQLESSAGKVESYLALSTAKLQQNQNDSAMYFVQLAKPIAEKRHLKKLQVRCLDQEAIVFAYQEKYDKSSQTCFKAIEKGQKISESFTIRSNATLGYVFMKLGNLTRSSSYSQVALDLAEKYKDTAIMLSTLNILALNLKNTEKREEALAVFERGLQLANATNNLLRQGQILFNMSNIYFALEQNKKGLEYFYRSIEISKLNSSYLSTAQNFHSLAHTQYDFNNKREALQNADSALHYAKLSKNYEMIMESYALIAEVTRKFGSFRDAFDYMRSAYTYKDSLNLVQLNENSMMAETAFEREKRRIEDSLKAEQQALKLNTQKRMSSQRLQSRDRLIWIFSAAFVLFLIAGYFLIKNNRLIKSQNILVNHQKEEIQTQHTEIRDSIDYAQRIQAAMINKHSEWHAIGSHYIFFRPKDVVSGDFYWAYTKGDLSIWVVADCTGHGVPGAFMSMLGYGFLNEIIIERDCSDAAETLNLLRSKIVAALSEKGGDHARDGMDVSVCIWNKSTHELQYAGANNPLWIVRHKSTKIPENVKRITTIEDAALHLLEIEPDKMPVGFVDGKLTSFRNKTIALFPGDVIIQLTDGFADQFGGPNGKKLKYAPMKRSLLEMQSYSFDQQKEQLSALFDAWRGDLEQVDDVCVVAVKVS